MKKHTFRLTPALLLLCLLCNTARAQIKKDLNSLPDLKKTILAVQQNAGLYAANAQDHSKEQDVNTIILDIEKYIDSPHNTRSASDQLLNNYFYPLRHFFLTTTNKTTVATMFLYSGTPYRFCSYNDTALALYLYAVKDGNSYNLSKTTESRIARKSLDDCLLPALKALDSFSEYEPKYIALSVYYGCKDTREGAPAGLSCYCLTLVARTADMKQYTTGMITARGLLANSELYLGQESDAEVHKIQVDE